MIHEWKRSATEMGIKFGGMFFDKVDIISHIISQGFEIGRALLRLGTALYLHISFTITTLEMAKIICCPDGYA